MAKRRPSKPSMRVKDGRQQPFTWFPNDLIRAHGAAIGPYAGWVYMALLTHTNKEAACWPAHETLAAMTGMSVAQVKRSLTKLRDLGFIAVSIRRPKTSVYTILDVPVRPCNSSASTSSEGANVIAQVDPFNSSDRAINSSDRPIQSLSVSYEVDVSEVEPPNQNHRTTSSPTPPQPTPSAPMPPTEEEGEALCARLNAEEDHRFEQFWEAYPRHVHRPEARKVFTDAGIDDATLADILAALQVQIPAWKQQGMRVGFKPADYLRDRMWLDVKHDGEARWTPTDEPPPTPPCKEPDCLETAGTLSDRRCEAHALARMRVEATCLLALLRHYSDEGADTDERDRRLAKEIEQNHVDGSAAEVRAFVLMGWEDWGDALTVDLLADNYIAAAVRLHRTGGGRTPELVL